MPWHGSDPVGPNAAAGAILTALTFTNGYPVEVVVALSSTNPFTAILRVKQKNNRIARSMQIPSPGGFFVTPALPQVHMGDGEALEVIARDILTEEVQATLFTRPSG